MHRPVELANVNLYDWIRCYNREKFLKAVKHTPKDDALVNQDEPSVLADGTHDRSVSPEDCLDIKCEYGEDQDEKENT